MDSMEVSLGLSMGFVDNNKNFKLFVQGHVNKIEFQANTICQETDFNFV